MAETIVLECWQCSDEVEWSRDDFVDFIREQPNTRINLKDSGRLNLTMFCCDECEQV